MNAHSDARAMKGAQGNLPDALTVECEQMVHVLDAQLADLAEVTERLTEKRREWAARLDAARAGDAKSALPRAPHGSVKTLVLRELRSTKGGLDADKILERVSQTLPMITKRSIRQALMRLSENGAVEQKGLWWHAKT